MKIESNKRTLSVTQTISIFFMFLFLFVISYTLVEVFRQILHIDKGLPILSSIYKLITFALLILYYYKNKKINIIANIQFNFKSIGLSTIILITVIYLGFNIFMQNLMNIIALITPSAPDKVIEDMINILLKNKFNYVNAIISVAIITPIVEEIIFRGIILQSFLNNYSVKKSLILSSLIFGICHPNPRQFIFATLFGLLIGWIFIKTKSVLPCIWLHFINNFIVYLYPLFGYYLVQTEINIPIYITICSLALVIVGLLLLNKLFPGGKHELQNANIASDK